MSSNNQELRQDQEPPHPSATEARQGATTGHMRWVLRISTVLALVTMLGAWAVIRFLH